MTAATIFALASAPGRAGIAVVRVSGPDAARAITALGCAARVPRRAMRAKFHDAAGTLIDDGLVLWFPAPHSFTGDDVAELQYREILQREHARLRACLLIHSDLG